MKRDRTMKKQKHKERLRILVLFEVNDPPAPDEEYERGILETGKAVVAAALSTIVGFGSITFSHYPGLISTGKVAILGALCTSLVAITLRPTVLSWRREVRRKNQPAMSATAAASSAGTSS